MSDTSPLAVITGAARGIGYATAQALHAAGHRVVVTDLSADDAQRAAERIGRGVHSRALDVTDSAMLAEVIMEVEASLGPITVWVNNAGIMPTGPAVSQDPAVADTIIDVNYRAVVNATRLMLPRFIARGTGAIVNIASATASKPLAGLAVYSGTKAAVVGFSTALRRELRGTGVDVVTILPYLAATALGAGIPAQRGFTVVTPEQVAEQVVRAIRRGTPIVYVPRGLGPSIALLNALPLRVQDWVDDLIGTDRIGLGGDPATRAAYDDSVFGEKPQSP